MYQMSRLEENQKNPKTPFCRTISNICRLASKNAGSHRGREIKKTLLKLGIFLESFVNHGVVCVSYSCVFRLEPVKIANVVTLTKKI